MSDKTLIERLEHFKKHQEDLGDQYGSELLYHAISEIEVLRSKLEQVGKENRRLCEAIKKIDEYVMLSPAYSDFESHIHSICEQTITKSAKDGE